MVIIKECPAPVSAWRFIGGNKAGGSPLSNSSIIDFRPIEIQVGHSHPRSKSDQLALFKSIKKLGALQA